MPTIMKELRDYGGHTCLVLYRGDHYVVQTRRSPFGGTDTWVYEADDDDGRVNLNRRVAAGGFNMDRTAALLDLVDKRPTWETLVAK